MLCTKPYASAGMAPTWLWCMHERRMNLTAAAAAASLPPVCWKSQARIEDSSDMAAAHVPWSAPDMAAPEAAAAWAADKA